MSSDNGWYVLQPAWWRAFRTFAAAPLLVLLSGCNSLLGSKDNEPANVWISHTAFEMEVGETLRLSAVVDGGLDARGFQPDRFPITWSSDDPTIVRVDGGGHVTATGIGRAHVFARADGKLDSASIRVGRAVDSISPWQSVEAGSFFTCALRPSGDRYCWGGNPFGSHGNGIRRLYAGTHAPVAAGDPLRYSKLTLGGEHACGVALEGAGYCWGNNSGRPTQYELRPQRLEIHGRLASIESGASQACALDLQGVRYCWGSNLSGALGVNTPSARQIAPVRVDEPVRFASLSSGSLHTCGVTAESEAFCWGSALAGELGDGSVSAFRPLPTRVMGGVRLSAISAGGNATCGLTAEGRGYCWGIGFVGNGLRSSVEYSPIPVPLDTELRFAQLETGSGHTCGRTAAGEVYCWGSNRFGQVGLAPEESDTCWNERGNEHVACFVAPRLVSDSLRFRQISAGAEHTCGVTLDGAMYCWGRNHLGQLGSGRIEPYSRRALRVAAEFD